MKGGEIMTKWTPERKDAARKRAKESWARRRRATQTDTVQTTRYATVTLANGTHFRINQTTLISALQS